MVVDISNRVFVVTGSSKGIGNKLVRALAKEKAKIIINYFHSKEQAKALFTDIKAINTNCILVKADVTNPHDVSKLYHETIEAFGRVDVLINNAGVCDDNYIQMMKMEQWEKIINVNLTGAFLCCREFSRIMIKQKCGKIINIASLKGEEGSAGQVNYSASKAGMIGLTKALAKELGKYNVAVNAVCPGFIVTDLNRHDSEKEQIATNRSLLPINTALDDLINCLIFISSSSFSGASGRVFYLDSRI